MVLKSTKKTANYEMAKTEGNRKQKLEKRLNIYDNMRKRHTTIYEDEQKDGVKKAGKFVKFFTTSNLNVTNNKKEISDILNTILNPRSNANLDPFAHLSEAYDAYIDKKEKLR